MRKDVSKVLTECYKSQSTRREGKNQFRRAEIAKHFDEVGGKFSMIFKNNDKEFGENLSYLPRFLKKNVGRKWDAIYSEISANLDRRSATQEHIYQHLFNYFLQAHEVIIIDDKPMQRPRSHNDKSTEISKYTGLYVDPRDGILKIVKRGVVENWKAMRERERKAKGLAVKRVVSEFVEMHKHDDGLWYVYTIGPVPPMVESYKFSKSAPAYGAGPDTAWAQWFKQKQEFEALSTIEKRKVGVRVMIKPDLGNFDPSQYKSPLTQTSCRYVKKGKHREYLRIEAAYYYTSRRSASKKELRATGL